MLAVPSLHPTASSSTASFATSVVGWDKEFPSLTPAQLQSKRAEFWDTRVQGRAECWQTLRVAVDALDADGGLDTALVILESAEMTPFDVDQPGVCFSYDSKGFKYDIPLVRAGEEQDRTRTQASARHTPPHFFPLPNAVLVICFSAPQYCLYTPSNLLRDPPPKPVNSSQPLQVQPAPQKDTANPSSDVSSVGSVSVAVGGKPLKFKVRFSNGLPDLTVDQSTNSTIGQLKTVIAATHSSLTPDRTRIYYLGKLMSNDRWSLSDIGMRKEMVLQCFIPRG